MDMTYAYNYILVLISSVALFYAWTYVEIKEGKFASFVCRIAPLTFGVYLLHENVSLRLIWPFLLGADRMNNFFTQFLHMLLSVLIVFTAGCLVDALRKFIFDKAETIFVREKQAKSDNEI